MYSKQGGANPLKKANGHEAHHIEVLPGAAHFKDAFSLDDTTLSADGESSSALEREFENDGAVDTDDAILEDAFLETGTKHDDDEVTTEDLLALRDELDDVDTEKVPGSARLTLDLIGVAIRQFGETPLLTREEEKRLAEEIVEARESFDLAILSTNGVADWAVGELEKVVAGDRMKDNFLNLGRQNPEETRRVNLLLGIDESQQSARVQSRGPGLLPVLHHLLDKNKSDYRELSRLKEGAASNVRREKALRSLIETRADKIALLLKDFDIRLTHLEGRIAPMREDCKLLAEAEGSKQQTRNPRAADQIAKETERVQELSERWQCKSASLKKALKGVEETHADYVKKRNAMIRANLRLVISIAKKFRGRGLTYLELIQEGAVGLKHGIDKFQPERGFKISTYVTNWIKQSIRRGIDEQGRLIRTTSDAEGKIKKVRRGIEMAEHQFMRSFRLNDEDMVAVVAKQAKIKPDQVELYVRSGSRPLDIDRPTQIDGESTFGEGLSDSEACDPGSFTFDNVNTLRLREKLLQGMQAAGLDEREQRVVQLRNGICIEQNMSADGWKKLMNFTGEGSSRFAGEGFDTADDVLEFLAEKSGTSAGVLTLEELGRVFGVTRERIRQIESKGVRKMRREWSVQKELGEILAELQESEAEFERRRSRLGSSGMSV